MKLLVPCGAGMNFRSKEGKPAIMYATWKNRLTLPLLKAFKENRADINRDYEYIKKHKRNKLASKIDSIFKPSRFSSFV